MNEIKRGLCEIELHKIEVDFAGRYSSLTIGSDINSWLRENYGLLKDDYASKYGASSFTQFASIFMLNMFESKARAQNYTIKLKEADFQWLAEEYERRKQEYKVKYSVYTFEQFADVFLRELLEKVNAAKKILTL